MKNKNFLRDLAAEGLGVNPKELEEKLTERLKREIETLKAQGKKELTASEFEKIVDKISNELIKGGNNEKD